MKKYFLLFILLLIPFVVKAEDSCESVGIKIDTVNLVEKSDSVIIDKDPITECNVFNIDLTIRELGDSIGYKISIKNVSSEDYEVRKDSLVVNSDYIDYELKPLDSSNIIKAKESKEFSLIIKYSREVPVSKFVNGKYNDNKSLVINLSNDKKEERNPNTSTGIILIACLILSIVVFVILLKMRAARYSVFIIGLIFIIPFTVYALNKVEIKINPKVIIESKYTGTVYRNNAAYVLNGEAYYQHKHNGWCIYYEDVGEFNDGCSNSELFFDSEDECFDFLDRGITGTCAQYEYNVGLTDYSFDPIENLNYYLKYDVVDDMVIKSYACYVIEGQEYCLIETADNYVNNRNTMINSIGESNCFSERWNNYETSYECNFYSDYWYKVIDERDGNISVEKSCELDCFVKSNGVSSCQMTYCPE